MGRLKTAVMTLALAASLSGAAVAASSFAFSQPAVVAMAEGEAPEADKAEITLSVFHVDEKTGERIEDANRKYGDAIFSSNECKAGDKVAVIVQGNPTLETSGNNAYLYKYAVKSVSVNGVEIQAVDASKGEYEFIAVAGANAVTVDFGGRIEISVTDLSGLNWKSLLTVDNLLRLIVLAVLMFVSSGFFITLIKKGKIEKTTAEEFANAGLEVLRKMEENFLKNDVKPLIEKQIEQIGETNKTAEVLMRVTLLAQENTPEARLEIIKELQKYKSTDQELAAKIQQIVDSSIKQREEARNEVRESINEIREEIGSIEEIEGKKEEDTFGKL